jgi:hypothetical protein
MLPPNPTAHRNLRSGCDHADQFDYPRETGVCFGDAIYYKAHFRRRDPWVRNDLVEENS